MSGERGLPARSVRHPAEQRSQNQAINRGKLSSADGREILKID